MISIDEQMAPKKNWGQMPFPKRMDALEKHTAQRTIRSDKDIPVAAKAKVRSGDNYSELAISPSGRHQAPVPIHLQLGQHGQECEGFADHHPPAGAMKEFRII